MAKLHKKIQLWMVLVIIVSLFAPASIVGTKGVADQAINERVQPALAQIAAESPDQMVRVIVQKADESDQAEKAVEALGGKVLKELDLINAFAAQILAKEVSKLAKLASVGGVIIDAPVRSSSLTMETVRDEFDAQLFSNQDGTQQWSSDWIEISESDGPTSGDERIISDLNSNRLQVRDNDGGGEGVKRQVDLSGAAAATLSFDFRREGLDKSSDYVTLDISTDGSSWVELDRFAGPATDTSYQTRSYDISAYLSNQTTIRLLSSSRNGGKDLVYFDNVQIEFSVDVIPDPIDIGDLPPMTLKTVADDFEAVPSIFNNNSGMLNWSSAWLEGGESDGATAGDIQVIPYGQNQGLRFLESSLSAWRTADLSGATFAELSFDYGRIDFEYSDYIAVEVSADGGATWTEIGQVGGAYSGEMVFEPASYDISAYISNNTAVRFTTVFEDGDLVDVAFVDNVTILYNPSAGQIPQNYYLDTLNVQAAWDLGLDGSGVTVAVVDSGITPDADFGYTAFSTPSSFGRLSAESAVLAVELATSTSAELSDSTRILTHQVFNQYLETIAFDNFGHGTHVAGIIGGNGYKSGGSYLGLAPAVNLISMKISDDYGMGYESDTVAALEWIFNNKETYNIRVVNLSIQSTVEQSYHDSALDAAVEILWFNGIVVVAAAGNQWSGEYINTIRTAPANDPFIITVGASDEQGNSDRSDDLITPFTARGFSLDGYYKPEIIAPGKDIVSVLASSSWWRNDYPDRFIEGGYFRISGTSMSAPMVAGAAALLLQAEPDLTPDQVKFRLISTSSGIEYHPYLDVYSALTTPTTQAYNWDVVPHQLLAKMAMIAYWASENGDENIDWENVDWDSVNWDAVNWDAVNWNAVNWNAVNWNAVNWNAVNWNAVNWNAVNWNAVNWNAVNWNAANWNSVDWGEE